MWRRADRHTDTHTHTQTRVINTHFASPLRLTRSVIKKEEKEEDIYKQA